MAVNSLKFDLSTVEGLPDPTTGSGEVFLFQDAMGQEGRPYVFMVEDPPNKTRPRHYHHADVLYVYVKGEHHIEDEGTYKAGDIRWTRGGHTYGPETTGPEGGAWWVISYSDPVPVEVTEDIKAAPVRREDASLPHFSPPYDWDTIDATVLDVGGVILEGFLTANELSAIDNDIDSYLSTHQGAGGPVSGSALYDKFLGHQTIRLQGLIEKLPSAADLIGRTDLVTCAERIIGPNATSVLLSAGELIQIQPGEPAQFPHRDTDSWPQLQIGEHPMLVNAIFALDDFTLDNGATYVVPDSWKWDLDRRAKSEDYVRAVMKRGDAVLFRGDIIHGGGENTSNVRRRALSLSYCAGWLRTVENSFLNVSPETARKLPRKVQHLLGYAAHDATSQNGGLIGLFECGDPALSLASD